ncbi:MAG: PilT/PilU family type 4a pilus ATPase [Ectothiorhodospiraceae bacterium]|nr:PilT/PilU family type 4a pilus ATPase [Chromatiales bacterium]MCP5157318.1 PilT/PilU family type 4a pilus ATPase [Ectothiorhodospiraceae bacterium]
MDISPYLKLMVEKNASDLFFTAKSPVKIKIEGQIVSVGKTELTPDLTRAAAYGVMNDYHKSTFEKNLEVDFAIALPDESARFRVNVFRQRGKVAMVLRLIPSEIPTIEELGLPEILGEMVMQKRGLILMVGATGSGKSTTLAAMINNRNELQAGHILTIEDPVEFSHPNRKSIVNQREIGVDTLSYRNALKSSLREAPDVILIGEIRDRETMEAALELSNTGHLALATLHANNANQALERVINLFPQELHKQLFMDLSLNLRGIISQRLVPGVDGKRVAAIEIMMVTPHIAELILKGDLESVKEAMQESGQRGMQTFDDALFGLYRDGRITLEEALRNADSRTNLEARVNFG